MNIQDDGPMGYDEPQCEAPDHRHPGGIKEQRETAHVRIKRAVEAKRRELAALEHLQKIVDKIEVDSPLEELLWQMTRRF